MSKSIKPKDKNILIWGYIFLAPQLVMLVISLFLANVSLNVLHSAYVQNISLNCLGIILSVFIYLSILRSRRFENIDLLFLIFIIINSFYMFSDGIFWIINGNPRYYLLNVLDNLVYCISPIIMAVLFWMLLGILIRPVTKFYLWATRFILATALFCILFIFGNLIWGYYYRISPDTGIYTRGPIFDYYIIFPSLMFLTCFVLILISSLSAAYKLILFSYPLLPFLNTIIRLDNGPGPNMLSIETFCALAFFYSNLYVRRQREFEQRNNSLMESRLRILQMQINPHFLYNTLSSVASLCDTDPEEAQEMIYRLSDYLHDNYSDISKPAVIAFTDEIDLLEHYLSIECVRFPLIKVYYDLRATNFNIPGVTLQPLVENAIRHGIRKKRVRGGNITITSFETEKNWVVDISDDGVGFSSDYREDDDHHIGILNVRTRLKLLCDGTLSITSTPGHGTTCRIMIPKE